MATQSHERSKAKQRPARKRSSSVEPPIEQSTPPGKLQRLADKCSYVWTILKVSLVAIFLLVVFLSVIYARISDSGLQITSIEMPSELVQKGFTPQITANKLKDKLYAIDERSRSKVAKSPSITSLRNAPPPDIVVPSTNVSVGSLIDYFFPKSKSIEGEITFDGKLYSLTLRIHNRHHDPRRQSNRFTKSGDQVDTLFDSAGEFVFRELYPYPFAAYLYQVGRYEEALEQARNCAYNEPTEDDAGAYMVWGLVLYRLGNGEEAKRKFEEAQRADPSNPFPYINWGVITREQEEKEFAQASCSGVSNPAVRSLAAEKYEEAAKLDPTSYLAANNLGVVYKTTDPDKAKEKFREAIAKDPQEPLPYLNLADIFQREGDVKQVNQAFEEAIAKFPKQLAQLTFYWGLALLRMESFDQAIEKYQRLIQLVPDDSSAHSMLGAALFKKGATYEDALKRRASFSDAVAQFRKALEHDPNNLYAHQYWTAFLEEHPELRREQLPNYISVILPFQKFVDSAPQNLKYYEVLARAFTIIDDSHQAVSYYKKGWDLNEFDCDFYKRYADISWQSGSFESARGLYQQMVDHCGLCFDEELQYPHEKLGDRTAYAREKIRAIDDNPNKNHAP